MALLALSLSAGVEKIGSYAGLAAVFGLAVLSLLYFAQAREVRRLRDWAGGAPERARREEDRVIAEAESHRTVSPAEPIPAGPAAAPRPTTVAARAAGAGAAPSGPAFAAAPAGLAAPALASATHFPGLLPATANGGATPATAPAPSPPAPEAPATTPAAAPAVPAALTAAAGTGVRTRPSTSPVVGNGRSADAPVPPPAARPQAAPIRTVRPGPPVPPRPITTPPARNGHARGWAVAGLIAGLLVLAGGVFAVTQLIGGGDSTTSGSHPRVAASAGGHAKGKPGTPFSRGSVTVAVLNGTPVAGLASQVGKQLGSDGFKQGAVTNASDQARSATIVSFFPGHKAAADQVRRALKAGSVQPIDATTQGIVCPSGTNCDANVVVTVGSDLPGH